MSKAVYFDMDGTLNEFYSVKNWLKDIHKSEVRPYEVAKPKVDLELLRALEDLRAGGYTIGVISWLSKGATEDFKSKTRKAKIEWLKKIEFDFDEVHLIDYGQDKHSQATVKKGLLIDDDSKVLESWLSQGGKVFDAKQKNWLKVLINKLYSEEV